MGLAHLIHCMAGIRWRAWYKRLESRRDWVLTPLSTPGQNLPCPPMTTTGHCVLTILRPGKTPDGKEVRAHLRRLVLRIRVHWPRTRITIRGDSHYGRREAMDWCETNGVEYVFGLSKNAILAAQIFTKTYEVCVRRAVGNLDVVRDYTETLYAAKSWSHPRRVVARIEATRKGLDTRYVVTSITHCPAQW